MEAHCIPFFLRSRSSSIIAPYRVAAPTIIDHHAIHADLKSEVPSTKQDRQKGLSSAVPKEAVRHDRNREQCAEPHRNMDRDGKSVQDSRRVAVYREDADNVLQDFEVFVLSTKSQLGESKVWLSLRCGDVRSFFFSIHSMGSSRSERASRVIPIFIQGSPRATCQAR